VHLLERDRARCDSLWADTAILHMPSDLSAVHQQSSRRCSRPGDMYKQWEVRYSECHGPKQWQLRLRFLFIRCSLHICLSNFRRRFVWYRICICFSCVCLPILYCQQSRACYWRLCRCPRGSFQALPLGFCAMLAYASIRSNREAFLSFTLVCWVITISTGTTARKAWRNSPCHAEQSMIWENNTQDWRLQEWWYIRRSACIPSRTVSVPWANLLCMAGSQPKATTLRVVNTSGLALGPSFSSWCDIFA